MAAIVLVPSVVPHAGNPVLGDRRRITSSKATGAALRHCLKRQPKNQPNK